MSADGRLASIGRYESERTQLTQLSLPCDVNGDVADFFWGVKAHRNLDFVRFISRAIRESRHSGRFPPLNYMIGIVLIVVGTACMILGGIQHRGYTATLPPADVRCSRDPRYPIALALFVAALGAVLTVHLAL